METWYTINWSTNRREIQPGLGPRLWISCEFQSKQVDYMGDRLKTPAKVDKQKFEQVLSRLISTPPIRSKELVGKSKKPKP
jgi:hypothetical protein